MNIEERHVALPKLYGAPAYARPPRAYDAQARPVDPDDLPIEAFRTDEDRQLIEELDDGRPPIATRPGDGPTGGSTGERHPAARPFSLRGLGRLVSGGR